MVFLISLTKQKKIYEKIKKINKQLKKPKIKLEWKSHPLLTILTVVAAKMKINF